MRALSRRAAFFCDVVLFLCALAAFALMTWRELAADLSWERALVCAGGLAAAIVLRIPYLVHELGHVVSGVCAGLRVNGVRLGWLFLSCRGVRLSPSEGRAGETMFSLRREGCVHARLYAAALGGPLAGLLAGGALLIVWGVLPAHPALAFFACMAPLFVAESLSELLPAERRAGKTDGLVLQELRTRTGETEVAVRVMTAQLLLARDPQTALPHALLFDVPVVREDSPAFMELLLLQKDALLKEGDAEGAARIEGRIREIEEQ